MPICLLFELKVSFFVNQTLWRPSQRKRFRPKHKVERPPTVKKFANLPYYNSTVDTVRGQHFWRIKKFMLGAIKKIRRQIFGTLPPSSSLLLNMVYLIKWSVIWLTPLPINCPVSTWFMDFPLRWKSISWNQWVY